jgi:hypothetical protein
MLFDVGERIFKDDLAPEVLAEERHSADNRTEVHQQATSRRQARQELREPSWESAGRRLKRRRPQPPPRFVLYCAGPRATIPPFGPAGAAA